MWSMPVRNIPVHPDDWYLLGMRWTNSIFLDLTLPFGLQSLPKILTSVADIYTRMGPNVQGHVLVHTTLTTS